MNGDQNCSPPGMPAHVIAKSASSAAGYTHNHFNIDARGAHDPAAVHAAVMQGSAAASSLPLYRPSITQRNGHRRVDNFHNYETKGLEGK